MKKQVKSPKFSYGFLIHPRTTNLLLFLLRKTHEQYALEIAFIYGDTVKLLGQYVVGRKRIEAQCMQCNYIWQPIAMRLLNRGCPACCSSKGEKKIKRILNDNNIEYKTEYCFSDLVSPDGGRLRFDFAIFDDIGLKFLIEYDGIQHFKSYDHLGGIKRFEKQKRNDELKNQYCFRHGLRLIRIPYTAYRFIDLEALNGSKTNFDYSQKIS